MTASYAENFFRKVCTFKISVWFFSAYLEEFCLQTMEETITHIAWPCKLKVGAKSKKG